MTNASTITSFFERIISIGVNPIWGEEFNDRLKILNVFTWTCILFCSPYYIFMFLSENYFSGFLFVFVQLLFSTSLICNKFEHYSIAKVLILISTNYSVLCLNFTFGYEAGFYLYYFTSPLIVFSFFNFRQFGQTIIGLTLYISSYFIAHFAYTHGVAPWIKVDRDTVFILYDINVILSFCYLIVLASSFSKFHYDASEKVNRKNLELEQNKLKLENLLDEKQTLLSETHHRVKNNLAVISGLFDLQLMLEKDPKLYSILTNSKNRIKSMSLIHESLYNQTNVSHINIKEYVRSLTNEIQKSMQLNKEVDINLEIEPIYFDLSVAIPCGLIINEVIINCFKHAFKETENPKITIKLEHNKNYKLCIIDNGKGFSTAETPNQNSLGLTLIDALSKQLEGEYSYENIGGMHFCLIFG